MASKSCRDWYIPELEDFPSQRALLHLQLNKAKRYYRELVVPGIGGVWFVRQLSWAVAAIVLAKELAIKPAKIANAIEALACKLEWDSVGEYSGRGERAFNRDGDNVWSFKELSDKKHYVQITYRMSSVNALPGLGLTTGSRFNSMELTEIGNDFGEAFLFQKKGGRGGKSVKNALFDWTKEGLAPGNIIFEGIGRKTPTEQEKEIISWRLRSDSSDPLANTQRRKHLIESFGGHKEKWPGLDVIKKNVKQHEYQENDIETAIAFDAMLECGRQVIYKYAELIDGNAEPLKNKDLREILGLLRKKTRMFHDTKGNKHKDATDFAEKILSISDQSESANLGLIKFLVKRDGSILMLSNEKTVKGPLFDRRKEITETEDENENQALVGSEESSSENKIRQLFELWNNCQ